MHACKKPPPIPEGYATVTPWIIVRGAADLIEFLKSAFGASEIARITLEDGYVAHAEVEIGDSVIMMFDARPNWPDTPSFIRLFVDDADAVFARALRAGATAVTEVAEHSFGDRVGRVRDPKGNVWWIQTHVRDATPDEMARPSPAHASAMTRVPGEEGLRDVRIIDALYRSAATGRDVKLT